MWDDTDRTVYDPINSSWLYIPYPCLSRTDLVSSWFKPSQKHAHLRITSTTTTHSHRPAQTDLPVFSSPAAFSYVSSLPACSRCSVGQIAQLAALRDYLLWYFSILVRIWRSILVHSWEILESAIFGKTRFTLNRFDRVDNSAQEETGRYGIGEDLGRVGLSFA